MKKYTVLKREMILNNPYVSVEEQLVQLPNGEQTNWYITQGPHAAIIIPLCENGNILMQKAYKHGSGEIITEFCSGIIEKNESPEEAAERELLEETGYKAKNIRYLGQHFMNPTGSHAKYFVFLAEDCEMISSPNLDAAEQIENFLVPNKEALRNIIFHSNAEISIPTIAAFALFQEYPEHL
jgi:8-oxo-dGTP pyrophosphatase MutT (NUDIX family)